MNNTDPLFPEKPTVREVPSDDPTTWNLRATCPHCGYDDNIDCFDVLGADPDHLFCNQCNKQFAMTTENPR